MDEDNGISSEITDTNDSKILEISLGGNYFDDETTDTINDLISTYIKYFGGNEKETITTENSTDVIEFEEIESDDDDDEDAVIEFIEKTTHKE